MITYICIGLIIIGCLRLMIGSYKELGVICAALGIIGLLACNDEHKETPTSDVTVVEENLHDSVYVIPDSPDVIEEDEGVDCGNDEHISGEEEIYPEDTVETLEDTVEIPRDTVYMHDTVTVYEVDTVYTTVRYRDTVYVEIPVESDVDEDVNEDRPNWKRPE